MFRDDLEACNRVIHKRFLFESQANVESPENMLQTNMFKYSLTHLLEVALNEILKTPDKGWYTNDVMLTINFLITPPPFCYVFRMNPLKIL